MPGEYLLQKVLNRQSATRFRQGPARSVVRILAAQVVASPESADRAKLLAHIRQLEELGTLVRECSGSTSPRR